MISFMKVPPTTYVLEFKSGKIRREGAGLSFFYYAPTTTIVTIPIASTDVPFVFSRGDVRFPGSDDPRAIHLPHCRSKEAGFAAGFQRR